MGRRRHPESERGPRSTWKDLRAFIFSKSIPEPNSGCWLWLGGVRKDNGYGIAAPKLAVGNGRCAHRVAYIAFNGPIPEGLDVMHSCDQPSCVNPHHLTLGTRQKNMEDMSLRGRGRTKSKRFDLPRWVKQKGKRFIARASYCGRDYHFGMFDTPEAAHDAALKAITELRTTGTLTLKRGSNCRMTDMQ